MNCKAAPYRADVEGVVIAISADMFGRDLDRLSADRRPKPDDRVHDASRRLPTERGRRTGTVRRRAGRVPGKVATDFFGRFLRAYVESEGIDTRFLLSADASSTLAFVAMEGGEAAYSFYGEGAADTLLTAAEVPDALFDETRVLHIGAISLLRGTTPAAVLATVERLKGRALISFDPNIRPGLVHDEPAYRALLARLFAL